MSELNKEIARRTLEEMENGKSTDRLWRSWNATEVRRRSYPHPTGFLQVKWDDGTISNGRDAAMFNWGNLNKHGSPEIIAWRYASIMDATKHDVGSYMLPKIAPPVGEAAKRKATLEPHELHEMGRSKEERILDEKHAAAGRKACPVATGVIDYFPDAIQEIARLSKIGNEQHNPGQPLHWDREKSGDESDALMRHFIDRGTFDTDGVRHSTKVAWRALALLQKELELADL